VKRALIELAAVLICAALGVGLGRSYDPKVMSWAVYLGLVFAIGALALILLTRLEKHFAPENSSTEDARNVPGADRAGGRSRGRV
jgi:hypothetical protein